MTSAAARRVLGTARGFVALAPAAAGAPAVPDSAAAEVENALLTHAAVAEAAVIGAPDEERGHIVKAFVVLKDRHSGDAATARALQDHVKAAIAPYKYPRAIDFVDALPKTLSGKVQRFKLRDA